MIRRNNRSSIFIYCVLTIIALGSWIITFAVLLTQPLSHIGDDESLIDDFSELPPDVARSTLTFTNNVISVNFDDFSLKMFWYFERFGGCDYSFTVKDVIEVFLDPTLAAGTSESTLSNIAPGAPVYRLDVASFCSFGEQKLYWADLPGFQMDFKLMPWTINSKADPASSKGTIVSTAGNYPFDSYHALINITARLVPSNRPLQLKMSITSLLPGFSVGTNYLSDDSDSSYIRSINIVRSTPVKIYAILVSGCIVFVSIVLFLITIDSCVFGYKRRVELLVLPVATVFAFTQLRQTLPGVPPGVGTILDYYINLPCFFLLAFSSILSIISLAWSSPFEGDSDTRRTWFHRFMDRGGGTTNSNAQASLGRVHTSS